MCYVLYWFFFKPKNYEVYENNVPELAIFIHKNSFAEKEISPLNWTVESLAVSEFYITISIYIINKQ